MDKYFDVFKKVFEKTGHGAHYNMMMNTEASWLLSHNKKHSFMGRYTDIIDLQIKIVSPIAWQHINLGGRFNLTGQREPLKIDLLLNKLGEFLA